MPQPHGRPGQFTGGLRWSREVQVLREQDIAGRAALNSRSQLRRAPFRG